MMENEQEQPKKRQSLWQELKPRTKREWVKWGMDIFIACLFIYMCYINAYSYAQGRQNGYNSTCAKFIGSHINLTTQNLTFALP